MLISRFISISFFLALIFAAVGVWLWHWPGAIVFGILSLYLLVKAYGTFSINSNFYIRTICHGDRHKKSIALTFDDGPIEGNTERILEILKEKNTTATFFCIGKNMVNSESLVKQIDAAGHLIGNHSFYHGKFFDLQTARKMNEELTKTDEVLLKAIHKKPRLFRPPYGVTNPNLAKAVNRGEYETIGWSVRSFDTISKNKNQLWNRVTKNLKGGDVILFHDYCENTIEMLPAFIDHVSSVGLTIAPLDQVLKVRPYA